jgi:hypothetical protein
MTLTLILIKELILSIKILFAQTLNVQIFKVLNFAEGKVIEL